MQLQAQLLAVSPYNRHLYGFYEGGNYVCWCQNRRLTLWCMQLQGQLLAVSPYESHLDERLFGPRAHEYDPGRLGLAAVNGVAGVGGISGFAFGGGRYRYSPVVYISGSILDVVCMNPSHKP